MTIGLIGILINATGCFGHFALTRNLYQWNQSIGGNDLSGKFVKSLVMYGLMIIPVYPIASFIDTVALNLIEFWSGSNPLAMNEGDIETQIVEYKGESYELTAKLNTFEVRKDGELIQSFTFDSQDLSWTAIKDGTSTKLIDYNIDNSGIVSVNYYGENDNYLSFSEEELNRAMMLNLAQN